MKKTLATLVAVFAIAQFSYAQWTTSGNNIYNSNTGSVGIGTTAPPTIGNYGVLAINGKMPSQGGYLSLMTNGTELGAIVANSQFNIQAGSGITTQFFTGSSPTIQISGSGNVGIGTTSPNTLLHLQTTHGAFTNTNMQQWDPTQGGYTLILSNYNGTSGIDYRFTQFNGGSSYPVLTFQGGNVAIGTTEAHGYKLAVAGNAIAEAVTVKLQGSWPDYVFKPNYNLPSLTEVKTYIDKNQHLPEMPSEKDVVKNGINLGEIVKLQTKKIEELTLYLIEKDKQVNDLQNGLNQLKQQLATLNQPITNPK